MSKSHVNENFIHNCGETKVVLEKYKKDITEMGFSDKEIIEIISFYLLHAPVSRSGTADNEFGLKRLSDFGWKGNPDMSKLEGKLLKKSGIGTFCFIKADTIAETLKAMDLDNTICSKHPRAVIKQNVSVKVLEDGSTEISARETRMECLFRHIRNSFAHNRMYYFEEGNILLEDRDDNGQISSRILIPKQALIDWIGIISVKET